MLAQVPTGLKRQVMAEAAARALTFDATDNEIDERTYPAPKLVGSEDGPEPPAKPTRRTPQYLVDLYRGYMRSQARQHAQAIKLFRDAIKSKPDCVEAHCNLAYELVQTGEVAEAIKTYRAATAIPPGFAGAYFGLGCVYLHYGRLEAAIAAFEDAIKLKGDYAEAWVNLGNARRRNGETEAAILACFQATQISPKLPEAHYGLGQAFIQNGQLRNARDCFERAVHLRRDFAEALCAIGWLFDQEGRSSDAADWFRMATQAQPEYAPAHFSLADALWKSGRKDEAVPVARRACELAYPGGSGGELDARTAMFLGGLDHKDLEIVVEDDEAAYAALDADIAKHLGGNDQNNGLENQEISPLGESNSSHYTGEVPSSEAAVTPQLPMGETANTETDLIALVRKLPNDKRAAAADFLTSLLDETARETMGRATAKPRLKWGKDNAPGENPAAFAWRAYQAEAKAGTLHRGLIGQEDSLLRRDLNNWLRTHAKPEGFDIPTKPEWNTRQLQAKAERPLRETRTEEGRLRAAQRYRDTKAALTPH